MIRNILTFLWLVIGSSLATAEPLPWSFYTHFKAAGSAENIQLGMEPYGDPPVMNYINYETGSFGIARINFQTESQTLYSFGYGDWTTSQAPSLLPSVANAFDLHWGFQGVNGSVSGIDRGYLSASGIFTSGTGNFWVSIDEAHDIMIDGKRALVRFHGTNGESVSRIEMTVTQIDTPEPATMVLAGIGIATLGIRRLRRIG